MGKILVVVAPRQIGYEALIDDGLLGPNEVRIKTLYSGISEGTEMTQYRGTNPYLGIA